jgi:hypothetical protein
MDRNVRPNASSTRRRFLWEAGGGFGSIALTWLLSSERASAATAVHPGQPHHAPRARRVIYLFMHGGPSHLETFEPKPDLQRLAGQPLPESFGPVATRRNVARNPLLATRRTFERCGQSGLDISDLFPHLATRADDLCVLRSCWADSVNHPQAVYQMNTGSVLMGKPSLGSWVTYGLGSESDNLPAFVVLPDPKGGIKGGSPAYGAGFLPANFQGTLMRSGADPILDLNPPPPLAGSRQRAVLDLITELDRHHLDQVGLDTNLDARIAAYELAYRMQSAAPEAVNLACESEETHRLYGLDDDRTREFGGRCLLARRLVERGVRFVQLFSGDFVGWDAHEDVEDNHGRLAAATDKPIAGLLTDLKQRGLLDDTLVIWGGEFGRMPMSEQGKGRDHNPHGFCMWLAGAGVRGGMAYGATDAVGLRAEVDRAHVHDVHATILYLLGLDHTRLTFPLHGRDERLTETAGNVIRPILS